MDRHSTSCRICFLMWQSMFVLFCVWICIFYFFFFNDTATTEIYTLSLHDALPISSGSPSSLPSVLLREKPISTGRPSGADRKSTRLNSSHTVISYAVFCLKKKKKNKHKITQNTIYKQAIAKNTQR